jgi:hypothetical protein
LYSAFQVRRLESEGLTAKQAEAITHVITEVLSDSLENVAQNFTSKVEMQKVGAKSTCASNLKLGFFYHKQACIHCLSGIGLGSPGSS